MASLDLRERIKSQIMTQVIKGVKTDTGWKVLIVDRQALRMISSCCKMFDLMDSGITVVEDLYKVKQPMIDQEAVYLMAPTEENIVFLKRDFEKKQRYKAIHIFFIDAASDPIIGELAHRTLKPIIKGITELNLSFVAAEAQVFTLDVPEGLHHFYSPVSPNSRAKEVASQLASVCAALSECPVVRYSGTSTKCATLARLAQDRIDVLKEFEPAMQQADRKKKSQLLILDRNVDLQSPLVHELTYQAAAYDMCPIKENVYEYEFEDGQGKTKTKQVQLGLDDELWDEFRHAHISTVFKSISEKFKEFSDANADKAGSTGGAFGTKELKALMKDLPQHQEKMAQFGLHLNLSERIMRGFTEDVEKCTKAEQNMTMQEDETGKKVKDYIGEVSTVITENVGDKAKIRALGCAVISAGGLDSNDLVRLMDLAPVQVDKRKALYNLKHFGVAVEKDKKVKKSKPYKRKPRETVFNLSRWTPVVKDLSEDAIQGKLDPADYPAVKGMPQAMVETSGDNDGEKVVSARKNRGGWAHKKPAGGKKGDDAASADAGSDRNRLIIFIPGAIGYNEIRTAYELSDQYGIDVVIGSHAIMTPTQFVDTLETLDAPLAGTSAAAMPAPATAKGGLTLVKGSTMPYTEASF